MTGDGPFLWLSSAAPDAGFRQLPDGGLCLSAFVFLAQGDSLLLGRYADDPRWGKLAGLDEDRRRAHGQGWTIPASHVRYGEDPRETGARVVREILELDGVELSEPRVETETYVPARFPELGEHYDVWFFFDAEVPQGIEIQTPPWYEALAFRDPRELPASEYARSHEDVVSRWLDRGRER